MSLAALAGRTFAPTEPVEVTREQVKAFAASIGGAYEGGAAPVTFPIVVAFDAMRALIDHPDSGLTLARVVHGEQRFSYLRPVRPGDVLTARLTVESVRSIAGADYLRTTTLVRDQEEELVVTASATLLHRGAVRTDAAGPPERSDTEDEPHGGRSLPSPRDPR